MSEKMKKAVNENKLWYKRYDCISSSRFTFDNSGNKANEAPPFMEKKDDNYNIVDIHCPYGSTYDIIGYTKNPPFQPLGYHAVAIMFRHKTTFETIWFHYRSGEDIDVRNFTPDYFGDVEKLRFESDEKWRQSKNAKNGYDDEDDEADAN